MGWRSATHIRGAAFALASLILLCLGGCGSQEDEPAARSASAPAAAPAPAPTPAAPAAAPAAATGGAEAARAEAKLIFSTRCMTCHGPEGAGDGPASAGLTPPPRNFQDGAWQASVTDQHIENIVKYGGAAVGKSPAMPANPDLNGKPEVVTALREHVRSLRR
jgi:mono/diheme cytochrome c family protein